MWILGIGLLVFSISLLVTFFDSFTGGMRKEKALAISAGVSLLSMLAALFVSIK